MWHVIYKRFRRFVTATRAWPDSTGKRTREVCHPSTNLLLHNPGMTSRRPFRLRCCSPRFHNVFDKVSTRPSRRPSLPRAVRVLSCRHHIILSTAMEQKRRRQMKHFTTHKGKIDKLSIHTVRPRSVRRFRFVLLYSNIYLSGTDT